MAACSPSLVAPGRYVAELMELVLALGGPAMNLQYERFRAHPDGQRLLAERPDLVAVLGDRDALAALPEGSFGQAYLTFTDRYRFDAKVFDSVHDLDAMGDRLGWDDDQRFVIARGLQMHDLWHTLTGYGPDWAGEGAVIAFTHGQVDLRGTAFLRRIFDRFPGGVDRRRWRRFLDQALVRGQIAGNLLVAPYEELLAVPLDQAREELGIVASARIHPDGIPYTPFRYGLAKQMDDGYDVETAA